MLALQKNMSELFPIKISYAFLVSDVAIYNEILQWRKMLLNIFVVKENTNGMPSEIEILRFSLILFGEIRP